MAILFAATACWIKAPAAHEAGGLASDQMSVRELMRLETAQALQRLRAATAKPRSGSASGMAPMHASAPLAEQAAARLVAIYGVGHKLMAEVRVDGQRLLFMRGRPEAVGPGKSHGMRLLGISGRCIEVAMQGRRESLCAAPSGTEGR